MTVIRAELESRGSGSACVSMLPGIDPTYLHISVWSHRAVDLSWLSAIDYQRFVARFGAPEAISLNDFTPPIKASLTPNPNP